MIKENDEGAVFIKSYPFETPSRAANFVLHANRNGWDVWCDSSD